MVLWDYIGHMPRNPALHLATNANSAEVRSPALREIGILKDSKQPGNTEAGDKHVPRADCTIEKSADSIEFESKWEVWKYSLVETNYEHISVG